MIKFPSINQFKNLIKDVRSSSDWNKTPYPTIKFIGTTKIHGTNSSVVFNPDKTVEFQSRERTLTIESDNAGFCMWGTRNIDVLTKTYDNVVNNTTIKPDDTVVIYAEFCGGSIQKGVALTQLPKMFVVFNITIINGENRTELSPTLIKNLVERSSDIFTVYDFPTWEIDIDFNAPQLSQNKLVEITNAIEQECPVGKHFGVSGIGEGVVWASEDFKYRMKVKGTIHSSSHVKTVKEIAACDIERMNSIDEFVETVITENRLNQGLDKLGEMGLVIDVKNTGAYLKWVVNDALKEEKDVIIASNFDMKEITPKMSDKAKKFWFAVLEKV